MLDRLKRIRNGDKVQPTFPREECQGRIDKLRRHMEASGIAAALFTSYHNINYFSDFLYCSFGRPYGLILTLSGISPSRPTSTAASRGGAASRTISSIPTGAATTTSMP
jgi:Xaa-Pro aminopeptidase